MPAPMMFGSCKGKTNFKEEATLNAWRWEVVTGVASS